jgi:ribosomal-protein-serine acetyltransferase
MFHARVRPDLELRLLEERHAPTVFALVEQDRAYLREWLSWVDKTQAEDDIVAFIRASLEGFAANKGFVAGMWWQQQFVGVIGTHNVDWINRRCEVGYWVGRRFQGQGIVTDATRAVVTHLLGEMDLHRVSILCATGNDKSAAIPQRLGFTLEGSMREGGFLNGRYVDLRMFAMLQGDWKP